MRSQDHATRRGLCGGPKTEFNLWSNEDLLLFVLGCCQVLEYRGRVATLGMALCLTLQFAETIFYRAVVFDALLHAHLTNMAREGER